MKVKVIKTFLDKNDLRVVYAPDQILEWDDEARIKDCTERGLIEVVQEEAKPKKATKKTGKQD